MDLSKHWMNTTRKIYMENTKWQQELSESTKKSDPTEVYQDDLLRLS